MIYRPLKSIFFGRGMWMLNFLPASLCYELEIVSASDLVPERKADSANSESSSCFPSPNTSFDN